MRGTTVYSSKTGLEIRAVSSLKKKGDYEEKKGKVRLRAFSMESRKQIRILLDPAESHKLGRAIERALKNAPEKGKGVTVMVHKSYTKNGDESISKVIVEYFKTKKGTEGVGIIVVRDDDKVNVPIAQDEAVYLADLLTYLAIEQSWFKTKKIEEEAEEVVEESEVLPEEPVDEEFEDI